MTPALLRLVRHKMTRAYFGRDGTWTHDSASACQFDDIRSILELQRERNLTEIEMVLQMGDEPSAEYDITLPLCNPNGLDQTIGAPSKEIANERENSCLKGRK